MKDATLRKTILVLAYSVSPFKGSEFAVGWDYITHMSREHDLVVLFGTAGEHLGDIEDMADVAVPGVEFVAVPPSKISRWLNMPNRTGFLRATFYLAYRAWQHDVLDAARAIHARRKIDIVHYLCPIGYREPGYLASLKLPYIWGPIGGMNLRPLPLFFKMSFKSGAATAIRNAVNWLQFRGSRRIARGIDHPDVLVASTSEGAELIRRVHGRDALVMPENAVGSVRARSPGRSTQGPFSMLWVGRIDAAKALDILIEALGRVASTDWVLNVAGDGERRGKLETRAKELGLEDRIRWHGQLPRERVLALYANADVHMLTSLAEAHSTVLWEAMSQGVPTVALDHCGMHDSICDQCGVRIPLGSFDEIVASYTQSIEDGIADRSLFERLSRGASECARRALWSERLKRWNCIYDLAIARWSHRHA